MRSKSETYVFGNSFDSKYNRNEKMIEKFRSDIIKELTANLDGLSTKSNNLTTKDIELIIEISSTVAAKMLNEYSKERVQIGDSF